MTLAQLQEKYGRPTLEQSLSAYYVMLGFKEYIEKNDDYIHPHNFQYERNDIVRYIYCSHEIVKEIIDWSEKNESKDCDNERIGNSQTG